MKQPTSLRSISHSLSGLYSEERVLFGLGLLGIGLGIIGLIVMAVNGRIILPQGDIFKPVSLAPLLVFTFSPSRCLFLSPAFLSMGADGGVEGQSLWDFTLWALRTFKLTAGSIPASRAPVSW